MRKEDNLLELLGIPLDTPPEAVPRALDRDELFRLLKAEALRFALQPRQLWDNYFLHHYPLAMLKPVVKIMGMDLYNVLTGRRYSKALDV